MENRDPAIKYTENFHGGKALAAIAVGFIAILGVAKQATSVLGSGMLTSPAGILPQVGSLAFWPLATTNLGAFDGVLWNLFVATSEESFKIGLINGVAGAIGIKTGISKSIASVLASLGLTGALAYVQITLLGSVGVAGVGYWTWLHSFQSIMNVGGLVMAFVAGLILLGIVIMFKNILPAIGLHFTWNVLSQVVGAWLNWF